MESSIAALVRKAARLAVYEEHIIRAKNHHMPHTHRVEYPLIEKKHVTKSDKWVSEYLISQHDERSAKCRAGSRIVICMFAV